MLSKSFRYETENNKFGLNTTKRELILLNVYEDDVRILKSYETFSALRWGFSSRRMAKIGCLQKDEKTVGGRAPKGAKGGTSPCQGHSETRSLYSS